MTRYDFLWARRVILSNVRTNSELDLILILVDFSYELGHVGGSFEKIIQSGTTNLIRFYIALNWGEKWFLPSEKQIW